MTKFNAAFWKWFGDSKVVDKNGDPLVVYHGTTKKFIYKFEEGFNNGWSKPRKGFYFTNNETIAREFGGIIPCYLSIKKPANFIEPNEEGIPTVGAKLQKHMLEIIVENMPSSEQKDFFDGNRMVSVYRATVDGLLQTDAFVKSAKYVGFDGIFINDALGMSTQFHSFIAFYPNQIKAIDNDGSWDADDPDIRSNPIRIRSVDHYDPLELELGTQVEMEHTNSKHKASIIARQHLEEIPDYYTRLIDMERKAKRKK